MKLDNLIIAMIFPAMALLFHPNPLWAQSESDLAETHFKGASAYYNQGKYEKALEEFVEAYRLMPLAEITFNIAQCYEKLGKLKKAIETYNKYIEEKPDAKDLQAVKDKVANLEERLEKTGINVDISEEGAVIFVDDMEVAMSPLEGLISVEPGSHELRVEKEGFRTYTMKFSVSAGLSHSASIELVPIEEKKDDGEDKGGGIEPIPTRKGSMAGYIAGYAVSGAVLIGGGVMGVLALIEVNKANDHAADDHEAYNDHKDKSKKFALATDIMIPAGLAGIVITTIVLGVKKPWKEKNKKVSLAPCLSRQTGCLLLTGSF